MVSAKIYLGQHGRRLFQRLPDCPWHSRGCGDLYRCHCSAAAVLEPCCRTVREFLRHVLSALVLRVSRGTLEKQIFLIGEEGIVSSSYFLFRERQTYQPDKVVLAGGFSLTGSFFP